MKLVVIYAIFIACIALSVNAESEDCQNVSNSSFKMSSRKKKDQIDKLFWKKKKIQLIANL